MAIVVILGSGVMGSALAAPLADNGHDVRLVGTHLDREIIDAIRATGVHPGLGREVPSSVRAYQLEELEAASEDAEIVVSGVNSVGVEWAGERLATLLRPGQLVIAVAKGVRAEENGDLRILPDVLAGQVAPDVRERVGWAAIIGPAIAGEVAARRETCVVFCGRAESNCYALGIGLAAGELERRGEADSPDRAHNYEAALFAQSAGEIRRWAALVGGDPDAALWLPGVGDLYVTSTGGRNVRVGNLLGSGLGFADAAARLGNPTLEGAAAIVVFGEALEKLTERGVIAEDDFPLMRHLYEVIGLHRPLNVPWSRFFGGEPTRRTAPSA
jgi:glycerol-3-phosphate dehydrogenase (NAD(P)+)